jgi:hypothetical protein
VISIYLKDYLPCFKLKKLPTLIATNYSNGEVSLTAYENTKKEQKE